MSSNLHSRWIGVAALTLGAFTQPAQAQSVFQACEVVNRLDELLAWRYARRN